MEQFVYAWGGDTRTNHLISNLTLEKEKNGKKFLASGQSDFNQVRYLPLLPKFKLEIIFSWPSDLTLKMRMPLPFLSIL